MTSVGTAAANNCDTATWATATTTPALTIGLGAITPTSVAATGPGSFVLTGSVTPNVVTALTIGRDTSGTPGGGFGTWTVWNLQDSTTADQLAARVEVSWVSATHASRTAQVVFNVYDAAGGRTYMTASTSGSAAQLGFFGASPVIQQNAVDLATGLASLGLVTNGTYPAAAAGTLTGTTLNSTVVSSSLTGVGTIISGTWDGATIAIAHGGTGQTAATAAKDALSVAVTLASATTTNLATALGDYVTITGTTTITGFGTAAAGVRRLVRFSGVLHLTQNSTSMILLGGADITTAANDMAMFVSEGSGNWRMAFYSRAANTP